MTEIALLETDSSPSELVASKATVGALSLSVMVYVCTLSLPKVALLGLYRVRMTVSLASFKESLIMLPIVIVVDVEPAAIVAVPLAKV